jgi:hypothetical protein
VIANGHAPAIWIYTKAEKDFKVKLTFAGEGFMTSSTPEYNDCWRIKVNPKAPFYRYSSSYDSDPADPDTFPFLDYDGFRAGKFQREAGWCIENSTLLDWQREELPKLGFTENEIDDVNYTYGRMLLERRYEEKYFAVYPQTEEIVDQSVALSIEPTPQSLYRLWLYFVPTNRILEVRAPQLKKIVRNGVTVVELAYLTDREIPKVTAGSLLARSAGKETRGRG